MDPAIPGLDAVIARIFDATFGAAATAPYEAEIARAVQRVAVDQVMALAASASMPQVRAIASHALERQRRRLVAPAQAAGVSQAAHASLLASDIRRFLDRPAPTAQPMTTPSAPPGAPIGEPAMEWLRRTEPPCSWRDW
jgi:hypothetical protein